MSNYFAHRRKHFRAFNYLNETLSANNNWTARGARGDNFLFSSGDLPSQWNDLGIDGKDLVQATVADQPTYYATGLNDKPTVKFLDDTDELKATTALDWKFLNDGSTSYTMVIVFKHLSDAAAFAGILRTATNSQVGINFYNNPSLNTIQLLFANSGGDSILTVSVDASEFSVIVLRIDTVANLAYLDVKNINGSVSGVSTSLSGRYINATPTNPLTMSSFKDQYFSDAQIWKEFKNDEWVTNASNWLYDYYYKEKWMPSDEWASTDLNLWLDASETDWKTGGSQEYLTFNASAVSQWDDRSGNSNDVSQATGTYQPVGVSTINSVRSISFVDDCLFGAFSLNIDECSFWIVMNNVVSANYKGILSFAPSSGQDWNQTNAMVFDVDINKALYLQASGLDLVKSGTGTAPAGFSSVNKDATTANLYYNGTLEATDTSFSTLTTLNSGNIIVGARFETSLGTNRLTGEIAEIVYVKQNVTTDQRQKVEGYLAHKWGLTANLDVSHPYKLNPPTV